MWHRMWTGYSHFAQKMYEQQIFTKWGGFDLSSISTSEIKITPIPQDTIHEVHAINRQGIPLIFISGYGASAAIYYKVLKTLSSEYDVYALDLRGMGALETEKYLVEGIEEWRKRRKISHFVLCGHSIGGYVATKYALQNKNRIMSLILISPAGVWKKPENFNEMVNRWREANGFMAGNIYRLIKTYWTPGKTPFDLFRICGRASPFFLNRYMGLYTKLKLEERNDIRNFLHHLLVNKGTGDVAMPYLIEAGGFGVEPLLGDLNRLPMKTSVYFGDCDWMYFGGKDVNLEELNPNIRERVIKGASHNIHFDEPELLMSYIMADLKEYLKGYTFI